MRTIFIFLFLSISLIGFSQAAAISLDGEFSDWPQNDDIIDPAGDAVNIDFRALSVTNDSNFLFIKIAIEGEKLLNAQNNLKLYIDTDNNSSSGEQINNIGADLTWIFGELYGIFRPSGSTWVIHHPDISFRALPTFESDTFEIAIGRNSVPHNAAALFQSDTIRIVFSDDTNGGDLMPDQGNIFTYIFDNQNVEPYIPIEINKSYPELVRLMTYNVLNDGLLDQDRIPSFSRLISLVDPDIITFNECWDTQYYDALDFLNQAIPLSTNEAWTCWKLDPGNITCSKYPISDNWQILPDRRITASLINLPEAYISDILVINCHFKCCDGDEIRQREADAIISFLRDAKTPGGVIDLPANTPFIISGDLNLVGDNQQIITLTTGDIIDNATFGTDSPPDWDNTDITDLISLHTDKRTAYTWRKDYSDYWPGRLDFSIYSDASMNIDKAFIIQTEVMSSDRLIQYGINQDDTKTASDHFPKITDMEIPNSIGINNIYDEGKINIYPNPGSNSLNVNIDKYYKISIQSVHGRVLMSKELHAGHNLINIDYLQPGSYIITLKNSSFTYKEKIVKCN